MKKLIALTSFILILSMLFCACGKKTETPEEPSEPSFTPMDTTCVIQGIRVSDGSIAFEDIVAFEIATAFNTITEYEAFDEEAEPEWETVFICTPSQQSAEGAKTTIHRIAFLGDNTFNISLDSSPGGKCKAVSETLYKAFADAILNSEAESDE
ncbi:MAG: hypothetical protein E7660_05680 [Ruminococcaceae bacterium]|nr:hypothetical protein [Oscillospiraceae bacterium]